MPTLMTELSYDVRTLGSDLPIGDAKWDVHAVANSLHR
jgi:hypothetical protein